MNLKLLNHAAFVALVLALSALAGCGVPKKVRKMLNPKASIVGIQVVENTPEKTVIRVDVRTKDVDLLLGFVKLRYKVTVDNASLDADDNVKRKELPRIDDTGLSFLVTFRHEPGKPKVDKAATITVQGEIVVKVIAELATVPFQWQGVVKAPE